jgi:uncharacterized protein (DUF1800 family)
MFLRPHRALPALFLCVASVAFFSPNAVHAQSSNCPLSVTGSGAPSFALDGVILTRFALGLRGPALYDKLAPSKTLTEAEANVGTSLAQLDVDGDGAFTSNDATILSRYIAGFRGDALTNGLTINAGALRKTSAQHTTFVDGGCATAVATSTALKNAARLLQQGTFGSTLNEITRVSGITPDAWLNEQFGKQQSLFTPYAEQLIAENKTGAHGCPPENQSGGCKYAVNTPSFYKYAFEGDDQLRQRVVNALLQTLVVSIANNRLLDAGTAVPNYMDMLGRNVFAAPVGNVGSFRTILKEMTLHPAMGQFLDMLGSTQEAPNENYARELLQLFSVGTAMLNNDGTPKRDGAGKTIPTYDEEIVQGFAKAFTGWSHNNADAEALADRGKAWQFYYPNENWTSPLTPWRARRCASADSRVPDDPPGTPDAQKCYTYCNITIDRCSIPTPHQTGAKKLLQYPGAPFANLPAGQTPEKDVEDAIDNVFNHPNVGPFIVAQLIQRLVTSNPSLQYVTDVVNVFNNNGSGVRGDTKAVVRAILLHTEARDPVPASNKIFGKLREPVIKFVHLHRAFNAKPSSGYYDVWDLSLPETLNQGALRPNSVFNFYSPDYAPAGPMAYKDLYLLGPEFEITNASTIAGFADFSGWGIIGGFRQYDTDRPELHIKPDYSRYLTGSAPLADNPQALIDELDLLLTANNLKAGFKSNLVNMVAKIERRLPPNYTAIDIASQRNDRLRVALWQIIHSADYAVQR